MEQFEDKTKQTKTTDTDLNPHSFKKVLRSWRELRDRLKPNGPAVDYAALNLYIAGELDPAEHGAVAQLIVTWAAWYDAYEEAVAERAAVRDLSRDR
jgi:hypothetical protein